MEKEFINLKNIEQTTKIIFKNTVDGNHNDLKNIIKQFKILKKEKSIIYEMLINDFEYYWNIEQFNYFLKKDVFINVSNNIKKLPSVWLSKWMDFIQEKYDLNNTITDLREYPFKDIILEIEKLNKIFQWVFEINENNAKQIMDIENKLLPIIYFDPKKEKEYHKKKIIHVIFSLSFLNTFNQCLEENEIKKYFEKIISFYYSKFLKKNEKIFNNYPNPKEIENIIELKEEYFKIKNEDMNYLNFFNKLTQNFESYLAEEINIKNTKNNNKNIAQKILIEYNYYKIKKQINENITNEKVIKL